MPKPHISYVPLEDMDERMQEEMHRCAREGTPRPESSAVRAHAPDAFWAFADSWKSIFHSGVCDHTIKDLCRVYISRTVKCEFCGNQRSEKAIKAGLEEMQYDDLLNFEKSDKYDDRQKAALSYAEAIAWGMPADEELLGPAARALLRAGAGRARLRHRAHLRPAELDPAARHRPPPVHGRHRRLDGPGFPHRRGARRDARPRRTTGPPAPPAELRRPRRGGLFRYRKSPFARVLDTASPASRLQTIAFTGPGWDSSMTRTDLPDLTVGWIGTGRMGAAHGRAARPGGRGPHRLEPHARQGRAAGRRRRQGRRRARRPARPRRRLHDGLRPRPTSSRCCRRRRPARRPGPRARHPSSTARRSPPRPRRACARSRDARGIAFLAAPVSGNGKVVAAGKLTLVVLRAAGGLRRGRAAAGPARPVASPTSARATSPGW